MSYLFSKGTLQNSVRKMFSVGLRAGRRMLTDIFELIDGTVPSRCLLFDGTVPSPNQYQNGIFALIEEEL